MTSVFLTGVLAGLLLCMIVCGIAMWSNEKTLLTSAKNGYSVKLMDRKEYFLVAKETLREYKSYKKTLFGTDIQLDAAGQPKLESTVLEEQAIRVLNKAKAWYDSDERMPFPREIRDQVELVLELATIRRKGVKA